MRERADRSSPDGGGEEESQAAAHIDGRRGKSQLVVRHPRPSRGLLSVELLSSPQFVICAYVTNATSTLGEYTASISCRIARILGRSVQYSARLELDVQQEMRNARVVREKTERKIKQSCERSEPPITSF